MASSAAAAAAASSAAASAISDPSVRVLYSEMLEAEQNLIIEVSLNALRLQEKSEKALYHKDVAQVVKNELDSQKGGTWNVVVGLSYGSFVSHETKAIVHFIVGNIAFLVWKHG